MSEEQDLSFSYSALVACLIKINPDYADMEVLQMFDQIEVTGGSLQVCYEVGDIETLLKMAISKNLYIDDAIKMAKLEDDIQQPQQEIIKELEACTVQLMKVENKLIFTRPQIRELLQHTESAHPIPEQSKRVQNYQIQNFRISI